MTVHSDRAAVLAVYKELESMHAWRGWHWWPDADPFEVAVGCILVQNTMWTNVERAVERLVAAAALTPEGMCGLSQEQLEELIRPSGQYRQKALKLRAFLALAERHGGFEGLMALEPVLLRSELLATWGIGPETADAMLCYAARQPAFAVDAYTMRLFGRLPLGPVESKDYYTWQRWMMGALADAAPDGWAERDLMARFHALIVMHCKHLCLKNRPKCGECSLVARCEFGRRPHSPAPSPSADGVGEMALGGGE
jgi:endonuclease-3 related protein